MPGVPSGDLQVLLLDADGNLFPSEEPAFVASADVTNRFLASLGVEVRYSAEHLLTYTTGRNFRATAVHLAITHGVPVDASLHPVTDADGGRTGDATPASVLTEETLDRWVNEEKDVVSEHLARVLRPDPEVLGPLRRLAARYEFAAVSSSALSRLDACFGATGLTELIPPDRRFSAEDSLPRPTSKPNPAVYQFALEQLGVEPGRALAVEDSIPGAQSAVAAGILTVGNVLFVAPAERPARRTALIAAGVTDVIETWEQLAVALLDEARSAPPHPG
jgi:HAD superfamily hydrolase (TIGR01509 family)